ncbi:MAG: outer membrane beta-barrel protein, partial [Bacteroidales bacterium]
IQNVGFSDYTDTLSLSKESGSFIHLGNIKLMEAVIGLQGVEVVAKRPIIERINNLTVMNVELASVFVGSDAFELLKKVPGVFVDKDGNISLYYKTVLVTIDNKELNLGADELVSFLKSIPFEEVSKLEINPNPTANFDAEGAGGIINIVTKKRVHNGIQGRVNVNTSFAFNEFRLGAGINASLSAKINKFTIVASMGIQYHPQYEKIQSTEKMLTDQGVFERKINNKNDKHWSLDNGYTMPFVRFELDYDINAKSSISLSFRANHSSRKGSDQSYNRLFFNSSIADSSFLSKGKESGRGTFFSTNLNYSYLFNPKGGKISIDLNYSPYISKKNKSSQENIYFHGDFLGESYRKSTIDRDFSPSSSNILYAKVDFSQTFLSKIDFSAGVKVSYVANNSNFTQYYNGLFDTSSYNSLKYIETISAIYASLSYQINDNNKINMGLRGEYTFSKMIQNVLDSTYLLNPYFNLFPDLSYSLKINDKNNLTLSYNYRISRPQYWDLDPKVVVIDEFSVNAGNIHLKPSYTHDVNLMHVYKNMFFSFVGYQTTKGMPYRFNYYNDSSLIVKKTPENVANLSAIYGGEQFVYSITDWWSTTNYCQFMVLFNDFVYLDTKESSRFFKMSIGTYHSFTFLKNYMADISIDWSSGEKFGFTQFKPLPSINIGFRANLLKNDLILSLRLNYCFGNKLKITEKYPNGNEINTTLSQYNELIYFSISYRFGKEAFDKSFRKSDVEEISNRIKMD